MKKYLILGALICSTVLYGSDPNTPFYSLVTLDWGELTQGAGACSPEYIFAHKDYDITTKQKLCSKLIQVQVDYAEMLRRANEQQEEEARAFVLERMAQAQRELDQRKARQARASREEQVRPRKRRKLRHLPSTVPTVDAAIMAGFARAADDDDKFFSIHID
jgi:hypothetical protein